jgi:hypothetical protein
VLLAVDIGSVKLLSPKSVKHAVQSSLTRIFAWEFVNKTSGKLETGIPL